MYTNNNRIFAIFHVSSNCVFVRFFFFDKRWLVAAKPIMNNLKKKHKNSPKYKIKEKQILDFSHIHLLDIFDFEKDRRYLITEKILNIQCLHFILKTLQSKKCSVYWTKTTKFDFNVRCDFDFNKIIIFWFLSFFLFENRIQNLYRICVSG